MLAAVLALPVAADPLIAFCASWGLVVPVLLVLLALVRDVHRRDAIVEAALGGLATVGLVKLGGLLYAHQRPFVVHHVLPLVAHAADNGFPSDHSAAAGLAVDLELARQGLAECKRLQPNVSIAWIEKYYPMIRVEDRARYIEGLRRAGLE